MSEFQYLDSDARQLNRDRLMAALTALHAVAVEIDYCGGGDSGDVSDFCIQPAELRPVLESKTVMLRCKVGHWDDPERRRESVDRPFSLREALHEFTLDWVDGPHNLWYEGEGGQGSLSIDVPGNRFTLNHHAFYIESNHYEHVL